MTRYTLQHLLTAGVLCCSLPLAVFSSQVANGQQPPEPQPENRTQQTSQQSQSQFTELNRGPVHEAFAQPYSGVQSQGLTVDQQPPTLVQETPPRQVPQSSEFEWIPGYWGWEPAEERYIWVTGIWRKAPQGMVWNPGYWANTQGGYAWVSGFWSQDDQYWLISETPPESKSKTPTQQPSDQHFWVPGHWELASNDFQWQEGFWAKGHQGFVWMPFRYQWTPHGYLAIPGYWDYELQERGVLFSPVYLNSQQASVNYTPNVVVRVDNLPNSMFVCNTYGHYVYGDYYDVRSNRYAIRPWVDNGNQYNDPLQAFYMIYNRNRYQQYRDRYAYYRDNVNQRPRHTWHDQQQFAQQNNLGADVALAAELNTLINGKSNFLSNQIQFNENQSRWDNVMDRSRQYRNTQQQRDKSVREMNERRDENRNDYQQRRDQFFRNLNERQQQTIQSQQKNSQNMRDQRRDINQNIDQSNEVLKERMNNLQRQRSKIMEKNQPRKELENKLQNDLDNVRNKLEKVKDLPGAGGVPGKGD